jgi:hypothetical protein
MPLYLGGRSRGYLSADFRPASLDLLHLGLEALRNQGKYEAGEEMQRQAMELKKKVLGPEHRTR